MLYLVTFYLIVQDMREPRLYYDREQSCQEQEGITEPEFTILHVNQVFKSFKMGANLQSMHKVLNGVDIRIMEREFVTIVGPSGCRKSTLLNIIAGLDRPDSASVLVRGAVVGNNALSTKIVTIFQEGALFPWLNVRDNVEFGLKTAKMPKEIWHQIADKYRNGRLV